MYIFLEENILHVFVDDESEILINSLMFVNRSVVALVNIPVECDSLHAALRLVLRLTREHQHAILFAELGGAKALLKLNQSSSFQGFISLATLIFRHILEEPTTLRHCMEKVLYKNTDLLISCTVLEDCLLKPV